MKAIAMNACRELALWIVQGCSFAWSIADRIERRWRIQGFTDAIVSRYRRESAEFLAEQRREYDRRNPDRLAYLYR